MASAVRQGRGGDSRNPYGATLVGPTRPPSEVFSNWGHIPQTPCQRGDPLWTPPMIFPRPWAPAFAGATKGVRPHPPLRVGLSSGERRGPFDKLRVSARRRIGERSSVVSLFVDPLLQTGPCLLRVVRG